MYPSTSNEFPINAPCPPSSAPPQPPLEPPPISIPPSFDFEHPTSKTTAINPTLNKNTSNKNINFATPTFHSPGPWSTGLCDCWEDFHSCCLTCVCPCITFGRIAEIMDRGSTSCGISGALYGLILCVTGCSCMYSCFYRSKLRGQYFLNEGPCIDCCVHCCCEQCSLCQEYRELQNQGFDMSIGWHGNMESQKRGLSVAPAMEDGMKR